MNKSAHRVKICGRSHTTEIKAVLAGGTEMEAMVTTEAAASEEEVAGVTTEVVPTGATKAEEEEAMIETAVEATLEEVEATLEEVEATLEEVEATEVPTEEEITKVVINQESVAEEAVVVNGLLATMLEMEPAILVLGVLLKIRTWKTTRRKTGSEDYNRERRNHLGGLKDPTNNFGEQHLRSKKRSLSELSHNLTHHSGEML